MPIIMLRISGDSWRQSRSHRHFSALVVSPFMPVLTMFRLRFGFWAMRRFAAKYT